MPNKKPSASPTARFIVSAVAACTTMAALWIVRHNKPTEQRAPAAVRMEKEKVQRVALEPVVKSRKATTAFQVSIVAEQVTATTVRLRGVIYAEQDMTEQEYNWILPRGYNVESASGSSIAGKIPALNGGASHPISITIDRTGQPDQPIVLHVFHLVGAEPQGQIAQFDFGSSNRPDEMKAESLDARKQELRERMVQ